ncbi:MAG TPA: GDSL-type esterase/lipase family protein, partial [Acidimicrobiales bacterium]
GDAIRLHLTNRFGSRAITLGPVRVGVSGGGPVVVPGSDRPVRFAGRLTVRIPVGADVVSDPVSLTVIAGTELAVSIHVAGASGAVTWHRYANSASYVSGAGTGDRTADVAGVSYRGVGLSWFWLDGIDTRSDYAGTIVAVGDSITDGYDSLQVQPTPWPDLLAARLENGPAPGQRAVVNAGIAGNRLAGPPICGPCGPSTLSRLTGDVLGLPGVTGVIVFEGTNDLGVGSSASTVIAALRQVANAAHRRGIQAFGATITPRSDRTWTPAMEAAREAVNRWIRTGGTFDAVFDFDGALRDPTNPRRLFAAYDSGDGLHPSSAGLAVLAGSIDTSRLA